MTVTTKHHPLLQRRYFLYYCPSVRHKTQDCYGSVYCSHQSHFCNLEKQLDFEILVGRLALFLSEDVVRSAEHAFNCGTREFLTQCIASKLRCYSPSLTMVESLSYKNCNTDC